MRRTSQIYLLNGMTLCEMLGMSFLQFQTILAILHSEYKSLMVRYDIRFAYIFEIITSVVSLAGFFSI